LIDPLQIYCHLEYSTSSISNYFDPITLEGREIENEREGGREGERDKQMRILAQIWKKVLVMICNEAGREAVTVLQRF
jgi:hypothetical protein